MIINKLTPERYELLEILEDARLRPNPNEGSEQADPRLRVMEAHLEDLLEDFDAEKALILAQLADELVARNTARIRYANAVSEHARAGHEAADVMVNLLERLMIENDIEKAQNDQMRLEILDTEPAETWRIVDSKLVPEQFWHIPDEKSVSHNLVAMHLEDPDASIPGIERTTSKPAPRLRRR